LHRFSGDHVWPVLGDHRGNGGKGNEKGGVKGELGWYRRNWQVPVPEAEDLDALNRRLLADCVAARQRTSAGRDASERVY